MNQDEKTSVKVVNTNRPLTFNEWSEKYNVSSRYVEPTKYFQGNPSSGIKPMKMHLNPIERFLNLFSIEN